jgi:chaperone BCS1
MDTFKSLLSPFGVSSGSLNDTLVGLSSYPPPPPLIIVPQKLVVIGGTVETARRASMSAWNGFVDCVFFRVLLKGNLTQYI